MQERTLASKVGGHGLHVCIWEQAAPWCMVQLVHGMSEHIQRYAAFARYLNQQGVLVAGCDNASHGKSRNPEDPWGYFGEKDGWAHLVEDVDRVRQLLQQEHPGVPLVLMGHSMGSFLTRTYLIRYPGTVDAAIIMGTGHQSPAIVAGGRAIAKAAGKRHGFQAHSPRVEALAFGAYNKAFAPNRTEIDWLSASDNNVDAYIADPLCGQKASIGLFYEMLGGIRFISTPKNIASMNRNTPILFISGDKDPVGEMGKGVKRAYEAFRRAGVRDVELKLYKGLRHEILNEDCRAVVYNDLWSWIEKHL